MQRPGDEKELCSPRSRKGARRGWGVMSGETFVREQPRRGDVPFHGVLQAKDRNRGFTLSTVRNNLDLAGRMVRSNAHFKGSHGLEGKEGTKTADSGGIYEARVGDGDG